jgi:hypothetical protein
MPPIHPSLYLCDPNFWIGMEGYYASARPDSFVIRKAMVPGPGHSDWKQLPSTMSPNTHGTWINVLIPTGAQAVPLADPLWNQNDEEDEEHWCHFIYLIVEGLKMAKVKPPNYSQLTIWQQGCEENPLTFLQFLKDAIRKHTTVDPESQVGEVLLKDKFLTQSASDNHRKLQKFVAEGEKPSINAASHVCVLKPECY